MAVVDHLYLLSFATVDEYSPNILLGPRMMPREFRDLCDNLLEQASFNAVEHNKDYWVGWNDIVDQLVSLLEDRGFKKLSPPEIKYSGSIIIDGEDDLEDCDLGKAGKAVIAHNLKQRKKQKRWQRKGE